MNRSVSSIVYFFAFLSLFFTSFDSLAQRRGGSTNHTLTTQVGSQSGGQVTGRPGGGQAGNPDSSNPKVSPTPDPATCGQCYCNEEVARLNKQVDLKHHCEFFNDLAQKAQNGELQSQFPDIPKNKLVKAYEQTAKACFRHRYCADSGVIRIDKQEYEGALESIEPRYFYNVLSEDKIAVKEQQRPEIGHLDGSYCFKLNIAKLIGTAPVDAVDPLYEKFCECGPCACDGARGSGRDPASRSSCHETECGCDANGNLAYPCNPNGGPSV